MPSLSEDQINAIVTSLFELVSGPNQSIEQVAAAQVETDHLSDAPSAEMIHDVSNAVAQRKIDAARQSFPRHIQAFADAATNTKKARSAAMIALELNNLSRKQGIITSDQISKTIDTNLTQ